MERVSREMCIGVAVPLLRFPATGGSPLPAGRTRRIGRGNLEVRNVVRQDAGRYRCSLPDASDTVAEAVLSVIGQ